MEIGELTGDWNYGDLAPRVEVGDGCFLERKESFERVRSRRSPAVTLGARVRVYTWSAFTVEGDGEVRVGDDSTLVGAVFWCAERISIGRRVVVSHYVMVADSDFHPRDPGLRRRDAIALAPFGDERARPPLATAPVVIEDDVQVGIGAIILKGVRIEGGARIGPGAVVTSNVPAEAEVAGNPARVVERR